MGGDRVYFTHRLQPLIRKAKAVTEIDTVGGIPFTRLLSIERSSPESAASFLCPGHLPTVGCALPHPCPTDLSTEQSDRGNYSSTEAPRVTQACAERTKPYRLFGVACSLYRRASIANCTWQDLSAIAGTEHHAVPCSSPT